MSLLFLPVLNTPVLQNPQISEVEMRLTAALKLKFRTQSVRILISHIGI